MEFLTRIFEDRPVTTLLIGGWVVVSVTQIVMDGLVKIKKS